MVILVWVCSWSHLSDWPFGPSNFPTKLNCKKRRTGTRESEEEEEQKKALEKSKSNIKIACEAEDVKFDREKVKKCLCTFATWRKNDWKKVNNCTNNRTQMSLISLYRVRAKGQFQGSWPGRLRHRQWSHSTLDSLTFLSGRKKTLQVLLTLGWSSTGIRTFTFNLIGLPLCTSTNSLFRQVSLPLLHVLVVLLGKWMHWSIRETGKTLLPSEGEEQLDTEDGEEEGKSWWTLVSIPLFVTKRASGTLDGLTNWTIGSLESEFEWCGWFDWINECWESLLAWRLWCNCRWWCKWFDAWSGLCLEICRLWEPWWSELKW